MGKSDLQRPDQACGAPGRDSHPSARTQLAQLLSEVAAECDGLDLQPLEEGFGRNVPDGRTELRLVSIRDAAAPEQPMAVAEVVTQTRDSALPQLDERQLAALNRWSIWGWSHSPEPGVLETRASVVLYRGPEWGWRTYVPELALALRQQAAFATGGAHSIVDEARYPEWRAGLQQRRGWERAPEEREFADCAALIRERHGLAASARELELVFEMPLDLASLPATATAGARAVTALAKISAQVLHPLGGVGYMATLALPAPAGRHAVAWASTLNRAEAQEVEFVPRFGAWGVASETNHLTFSMFWPFYSAQAEVDMVQTLAGWTMLRARWLRDRIWPNGLGQGASPPGSVPATTSPVGSKGQTSQALQMVHDVIQAQKVDVQRTLDGLRVTTSYGNCEVVAHRTERSVGAEPEHRLRTVLMLPEDLQATSIEDVARINLLAGTAALVGFPDRWAVVSQGLLDGQHDALVSMLAAASASFGDFLLLEGFLRLVTKQGLRSDVVPALSAWKDFDLERIGYALADVTGVVVRRHLTVTVESGGAVHAVHLQPVENHPAMGAGLVCTIEVSGLTLPGDRPELAIAALNWKEFTSGDLPFFGAWCVVDGRPAFTSYLPNGMKSGRLTEAVTEWLVARAARLDQHWITEAFQEYLSLWNTCLVDGNAALAPFTSLRT